MSVYITATAFFIAGVGFLAAFVAFVVLDIKSAIHTLREPENKALLQEYQKHTKAERIIQDLPKDARGEATDPRAPQEQESFQFIQMDFTPEPPKRWPKYDVEYVVDNEIKAMINSVIQEVPTGNADQTQERKMMLRGVY